MKKILHIISLCLGCSGVFAQGELPVNLFTGTPTVTVPIWNVVSHDLSEPVSLVYSASGVKLEQADGYYGLGWSLAVGGSISREVRSLPDDVVESGSEGRRGWLYTYGASYPVASTIGSFANGTPLVPSSCTTAENTDNAKIASFEYVVDTEPDVFYYNFGGQSGSFVFDNSTTPVIRFMPMNDLQVVPTRHPTTQQITAFTVTTNDGVKYFFNESVSSTKKTTQINPSTTSGNPMPAFKREYEYYKNALTYNTEWVLTRIESPSGAFITFTYNNLSFNPTKDIKAAISDATSTVVKTLYTISETTSNKHVVRVETSEGIRLELKDQDGLLTKIQIHDDRRSTSLVKEFLMTYDVYKSTDNSFYERQFLTGVQEVSGCDVLPLTTFDYVGLQANNTITLPSPVSKSKDYWGYFNGRTNTDDVPTIYVYPSEPAAERYRLAPIPGYSGTEVILTGADRTPNESAMRIGVLNKITYPTGGITELQYEANRYYDSRTSQTVIGGGLRVSSIKYFDGMNPSAQIVKTYNYTNAGQSTGKLFGRPSYAIPAYEYRDPYTFHATTGSKSYASLTGDVQSLWKHLTIRTTEDLSQENSFVGYSIVTVARPGSGSAKFEYTTPGAYGDAASGSWSPTESKFTRPSASCPSMGIVTGGSTWAYPFAPNPNFNHERGLVTRKTEFDETGTTVRVLDYTYQYLYKTGSTPATVYGLKFDMFANSDYITFFFGKYGYLTDIAKPVQLETVTYKAAPSRSLISSTEYFYASTAHKLLTKVKRTEADGTIYYTKLKYPLDYGTIADPADEPSQMIRNLQTAFRNGVPIETVNTVVRPSDTEKVTGGAVNTFSQFFSNHALLKSTQSLSIDAVLAVASFTDSKVQLTSGTNTFVVDSRYEVINTVTTYETYDRPFESKGIDKTPLGTVWGYNYALPIVSYANMNKGEFAFSDFETSTVSSFTQTNTFFGTGRTGQNAVHPYATLTKTLSKDTVSNYVVSLWLKKASAGVGIRVRVRNTALTTTYHDQTYVFTPSGTDFEYFKAVIPATTFPSTFTVDISSALASPGSSSPSLTPVMDDVAFYPENGDFSSITYTLPFGADATTDSRAMTSFVVYDKLGRIKHVKDKDKNIIQRNTFTYAAAAPQLSATFTFPASIYKDFPVTFTSAENACVTSGLTYEWSIDGGSFVAGTVTKTFTFTSTGPKVIMLRVSHATYGTVTRQQTINVGLKPIDLSICAKGVTEYNCATGTVIYTAACPSISATPPTLGTIFRVGVTEDIVPTYQWKKRDVGSSTWINVGTSSNSYTFPGIDIHTNTFEVICEATVDGRTGTSPVMQVIVYPCNP